MINFKFLDKNKQRILKYLYHTNILYKKRTIIAEFTYESIPNNEILEFWGGFSRFINKHNENDFIIESIYFLRRRKKWDGTDSCVITFRTKQKQIPLIGINDFVRIKYKLR